MPQLHKTDIPSFMFVKKRDMPIPNQTSGEGHEAKRLLSELRESMQTTHEFDVSRNASIENFDGKNTKYKNKTKIISSSCSLVLLSSPVPHPSYSQPDKICKNTIKPPAKNSFIRPSVRPSVRACVRACVQSVQVQIQFRSPIRATFPFRQPKILPPATYEIYAFVCKCCEASCSSTG